MRLGLIGSESFIGRVLRDMCTERGIDVAGIDAAEPSFPGGIKADIRSDDLAELLPENLDAVVHLAAISRDKDCAAHPVLAWDVNVGGTARAIEAAGRRNCRQFLFASTEWVYGTDGSDAGRMEDAPLDIARNGSEYAATKMAGETLVRFAQARGTVPAATVLRFGIVYGPRTANWSAVEALTNDVLTKSEVKVGNLSTARRFIHVRDIAAGLLAAVGADGYRVYNLAGADLVTLADVIEAAKGASGRSPAVVETSPGVPNVRNPVPAKAEAELGWRPAIGIAAGVSELVTYLRDRA